MAPSVATTRLRKELQKLQKDPPPGIIAEPVESDILTWYYAIKGPADTPYAEGTYIGKIKFPDEYPMKAPSIYMLTPNGRFQINMKLCMSMSDYHPESWNPLWSVSSIIQGIQSFMASDEITTGGIRTPVSEQKRFAAASMEYNKKTYPKLFDGDIDGAFARAEQARQLASSAQQNATKRATMSSSMRRGKDSKSTSAKTKETDDSGVANLRINDSNEDEHEEGGDVDDTTTNTLTPEEIEKRRKKNAKKRAKQKAKKATAAETTAAVVPSSEEPT